MNPKYFALAFLFLTISCGPTENQDPSSGIATTTIDGQAFSATEASSTDTGNGLEIIISAGDQVITFLTDNKIQKTYTFVYNLGDESASSIALGSYKRGTDFYVISSGTFMLTVGADAKISADFTFIATKSDGTTVSAANGKLMPLAIVPVVVPTGRCLVSATLRNSSIESSLFYNSQGQLLQRVYPTVPGVRKDWYIWSAGLVVKVIYTAGNSVFKISDWSYTSEKLAQTIDYETTTTQVFDYTLNSSGKPTEVAYSTLQGVGSSGSITYTYNTIGNLTKAQFGPSSSTIYADYDSKPNWQSFIGSSLGTTFVPGVGDSYGKNNFGSSTFNNFAPSTPTYTYNAAGNVASILVSGGTLAITYAGCN